ncbi:Sensor histidine kinase TmoS [bacterium HR21]|nr:Sensor histidine kinase TmoS [bacterium HR21]
MMLPLRQPALLVTGILWGHHLAARLFRRQESLTPFLKSLFEHLPLAAVVVDERDTVLRINPAFTELFGYTASEAVGRPIDVLIIPEELRAEGKRFTEAALHGEPISTETLRQCRSGERIPVWLRAIPVHTFGRRLGVLALYQDIRPLHTHRQQLQQLIEELRQLNATKDHLMAVISHDLRAPLATAQGLVGLILADAHSPDAVTDHATKLQKLLREQLELVNELLEFSRTETGRQTLEIGELDLCEILTNAVDTVALAAYSKQIQLVPSFPDEPIRMQGDAQKLQRIFTNLLANAIKFTPENGRVELQAWVEAGSPRPVVVRIRDSGIGIPPEQLPHLFEPFSPARQRGTRGESGTGLGLAIVKRFVDMHGGVITVESTPGQGTTFVLRFPSAVPVQPAL